MPFDETSPWLRLDPELLEPLTQDQITVRLRRKQPIFYQGDMPSTVYVVKEGQAMWRSSRNEFILYLLKIF